MRDLKTYFSLRKPGHGRKTFRICSKKDGKWKTLDLAELKDLNSKYRDGRLSFSECEQEVKKLLKLLYKARDSEAKAALKSNEALMNEYFAYKYLKKSRQRRLAESTSTSAYNDLKRAILAVGNLDLRHCSTEKLQDEVDTFYDGYSTVEPHRRTVMRVNALLRFYGRPATDKLDCLPEEHNEVKNLSYDEYLEVISRLDGFDKILSTIAYFSGLRLGEIFGVTKKKVRRTVGGYILNVDQQMYRNGKYGLPKRRKVRRAFAFDGCKDALDAWLSTPEEKRRELRVKKYWKVVGNACADADVSQVLSFKDWRHCYAISLLNMGATISQVAQNLGNSEQVCRKYYIGYVMTNDGIEMMARTVSKSASEAFSS